MGRILLIIAMSFKAMPSTVTRYSSFELVHGMQINTAFDHAIATISAQLPQDVNTFLTNLRRQLVIMRDHAIAQSKVTKEAQKIQYDKRHKVKQVTMTVGQKVLLHHSVGCRTIGKAKKVSSSFNRSF